MSEQLAWACDSSVVAMVLCGHLSRGAAAECACAAFFLAQAQDLAPVDRDLVWLMYL